MVHFLHSIGTVVMLVLKLWPSINIAIRKHVTFPNMLFILYYGLQQRNCFDNNSDSSMVGCESVYCWL